MVSVWLSPDLDHVVWFPGLVEELDAGAVQTQGHQEMPSAHRLNPVRRGRLGWLVRPEPQIDRAVLVRRDVVEAVDRWHELWGFHHRPIGDVIRGDGPEQGGRRVRRQMELVDVPSVQELARRVADRE